MTVDQRPGTGSHPESRSAGGHATTDQRLHDAVARSLGARRRDYPEAGEALDSVTEGLADVLGLEGAARDDFRSAAGSVTAPAGGSSHVLRLDGRVPGEPAGRSRPGRKLQQDATWQPCPSPAVTGPIAQTSLEEQAAGPLGHICLGCGCRIAEGLREIPVRGRRGRVRYRHAVDNDCADALRAPQPNRALIGRYEALSGFSWD